jgi:hypothetical protein
MPFWRGKTVERGIGKCVSKGEKRKKLKETGKIKGKNGT